MKGTKYHQTFELDIKARLVVDQMDKSHSACGPGADSKHGQRLGGGPGRMCWDRGCAAWTCAAVRLILLLD